MRPELMSGTSGAAVYGAVMQGLPFDLDDAASVRAALRLNDRVRLCEEW